MDINYSYTKEFEDVMNKLKKEKNFEELAHLDGILDQIDMVKFSKNFFKKDVNPTADVSVDSNSNVEDSSMIAYEIEGMKPLQRLNAYYLLYKYGKKLFGKDVAEEMITRQFNKDYYINDFHKMHGISYSYSPYTVVVVKHGSEIIYTTMEDLWKRFEDKMIDTGDRQYYDMSDYEILNNDNKFVKLKTVLRHKTDKKLVSIETNNGLCTIVTTNHPVIKEDGSSTFASDLTIGDKIKMSSSQVPLNGTSSAPLPPYMIGFWIGNGSVSTNNKLGHLSHERKLPKDVLMWKKEDIIELLCGLIDAEATIMPTGAVIIRMNSFTVIQQVSEIAKALGLKNVTTRLCGSLYTNREMYSVSFRITDELMPYFSSSVKVSSHEETQPPINKDGRFESSRVVKITEYEDDFGEYVYDVTTETGDFHCQGMIQHNCFNYSCLDVVIQGLPFVAKIKSEPPKHLSSFMGQMIQFITYASNSIAGAVGLADFLLCTSWFVDKMFEANKDVPREYLNKQIKQELQSFIYSVNQPFRGGVQSAFTNLAIFDDVFLDRLCNEYLFPDGSQPNKETVKLLQKMYVDLHNETLRITPFTFPVVTACFAVDDDRNIIDKDFLNFVAENNLEFGFMNIYAGKTSTLSSCCFDGSQIVLTKTSDGIKVCPIKDVVEGDYNTYRRNLTVFHNGSWVKAKVVKLSAKGHNLYKVVTHNNKVIYVTDNHINLTQRGNVETTSLVPNKDYLAFNTRQLDTFVEADMGLTYNQGVLIGAYLGDGSKYKRNDSNSYEVTFSLSENKLHLVETISKGLADWGIDKSVHVYSCKNNVKSVRVYSKELYDIINEFVVGSNALEKGIMPFVFGQSVEFRQGILDGLCATDGGNSCRIYSSSDRLIADVETLCTTLGLNTIINEDNRDSCTINGVEYNRNSTVKCIKWYNLKNKRGMGDGVKVINNTEYFLIKSVEQYDYADEYVYCFEVDNPLEPYFTLPNGVITHNCRLRSDTDKMYVNSFGSGGTKIGSCSVTTLNLPRISYTVNNKEEFIDTLKKRVELIAKINYVKRYIVDKRIKSGNLPLYTLGFMELDRQYLTCGINGVNEAVEILGYDVLTKEGQKFVEEILTTVNDVNSKMEKEFGEGIMLNCEQTPSENSAIKLATADRILGYNDKYELYSNQFIPLITKADLLDRVKLQGMFDNLMTGGAICHLNVDTEIKDKQLIIDLINTAVKMGVVYHAINYNIQECSKGHISVGKGDTCHCGAKIINNYTRTVG